MERIKYKKGSGPRSWRPIEHDMETDAKCYLTCKNNHPSVIRTHQITNDGFVNPSLICPITYCDEHTWGILEDWSNGN